MKPPAVDWALVALRDPARLDRLTPSEWSLLIRQARRAGVLARIGCKLDAAGLSSRVPEQALSHIRAEQRLALAQHVEFLQEIHAVQQALEPLADPVLVLKGAAYLLLALPANEGRSFSDIDLLVPRRSIEQAESLLMQHGWMTTHHDAYDQRYYRQWMHELPPLRHVRRQSVLDLHHTILPQTARVRVNASLLFDSARPIADWPRLMAPAPVDMVLHSMTHLFFNDDFSRGLRDLSDLDLLLRHFGSTVGWWAELLERSRRLNLVRPLHYGLTSARALLGTPVPDDVVVAAAEAGPGPIVSSLMQRAWTRALASQHESAADRWTPAALALLYLRGHWLRMPPGLLARHLLTKAFRRVWEKPEAT